METFQEIYDSPIGTLYIQASNEFLLKCSFRALSKFEAKSNRLTQKTIAQLSEYFQGNRKNFELPLSPEGTDFQKKVWKALELIPFGKTASYKTIANQLGDYNKVRAVGMANGSNPIPIIIPCHRVIANNGALGGFSGGIWRKEWLLHHENAIEGKQLKLF